MSIICNTFQPKGMALSPEGPRLSYTLSTSEHNKSAPCSAPHLIEMTS